MNTAVNSVMRGNISSNTVLGLFKIPNITLQKRVKSTRLQQKFQKDTNGEKSNTKPDRRRVFSEAEEKKKTCGID
jgi:hypothetical protein